MQPKATLQGSLPSALRPIAALAAPVLALVAARAIAVGIGCDSSLDAVYPPAERHQEALGPAERLPCELLDNGFAKAP